MEFPCGRLSIQLGQSTSRRIGTLTLQTVGDVYWNGIYKGGRRPAIARLKNSRVPDLLISTGFPRTNGEVDRATDRTDNSGKREAGLYVARPFVPAFGDTDLNSAIHSRVSHRSQVGRCTNLEAFRGSKEQGIATVVSHCPFCRS